MFSLGEVRILSTVAVEEGDRYRYRKVEFWIASQRGDSAVQWQEMTSGRFDLLDMGLLWHGGTVAGKAAESRADAEESVCRWRAQKQGRGWERGKPVSSWR